jgi:hypothetical protein
MSTSPALHLPLPSPIPPISDPLFQPISWSFSTSARSLLSLGALVLTVVLVAHAFFFQQVFLGLGLAVLGCCLLYNVYNIPIQEEQEARIISLQKQLTRSREELDEAEKSKASLTIENLKYAEETRQAVQLKNQLEDVLESAKSEESARQRIEKIQQEIQQLHHKEFALAPRLQSLKEGQEALKKDQAEVESHYRSLSSIANKINLIIKTSDLKLHAAPEFSSQRASSYNETTPLKRSASDTNLSRLTSPEHSFATPRKQPIY